MSKLKWAMLAEVYGRMNAELIKSLLNANGIEVELFQEAAGGNYAYPTNFGELSLVQIFVLTEKLAEALDILENSQIDPIEN
jgi:hypothetical protein